MNSWTIALALLVCAVSAPLAHADQCEWVDHAVAARAAGLIARHRTIVDFCQPCGDAAPGTPHRVGDVSVRPTEGGLEEVMVDGRSIDLAYTYVDAGVHPLGTTADRYGNLAALAGCLATGVSPGLRVDSATSRGVLIVPDDAAVVPPAPPPARAKVAPAPAPPRSAAPALVLALPPPAVQPGWIFGLFILLGGGALGGAAILGLFGVAALRRRRPPLPRALALSDRLSDRPPAPGADGAATRTPRRAARTSR